ncbi:SOS response-associated peptidase [Pseudoclavibacter alba]|uniref:Abasic site processing protein n=1 Tax=Pseudoclavibacter albus TaxID=272241 RepID=A0ABT2HV11_9MICO|nr:SOS response-associated peptidase [Pseudoclavibacter alba]MCT2042160.1 SOS response-associated peptidase [Pseudoclavibacter alba]
MCGRFVVARAKAELLADFQIDVVGPDTPDPSFNHAPMSVIPIITISAKDASHRRLEGAKWGLVPPWANDPTIGVRAFNARSESVHEKPTFRHALTSQRAIVPASGYYEWQKRADGSKQPFYLHPEGDSLPFAALYEWWKDPSTPESPWLLSATILTQAAEGHLADIHDRMPVMLREDLLNDWISPQVEGSRELVSAITNAGQSVATQLTATAVSSAVGNVRNNGPELIQAIDIDR